MKTSDPRLRSFRDLRAPGFRVPGLRVPGFRAPGLRVPGLRAPGLLAAMALFLGAWAGSGPAAPSAPAAERARTVAGGEWRVAEEGHPWSFPRDHWAHEGYRTEWWYFTGHLEDATGREYGFQFTVFQVALTPSDPGFDSPWTARGIWMGHASVTDPAAGRHVFSEVLHRTTPFLAGFGVPPDPLVAWSVGPAGTEDRWELSWNGEGFEFRMADEARGLAFALRTRAVKPLVFQGPGGFSRKGRSPDSASLYYSFTRLETEGWLELGGERRSVRGESWMDKEIGSNQLTPEQVGWDWFSLQLDDGREIMLYVLRRADETIDFSRGTLVSLEGAPTYLDGGDWSYRSLREWTSEETGITYPLEWEIEVPAWGLRLSVEPRLDGQENVGRLAGGLSYWEGAVSVRDAAGGGGRGYVELTGYGAGNRPPI